MTTARWLAVGLVAAFVPPAAEQKVDVIHIYARSSEAALTLAGRYSRASVDGSNSET